MPPITKKDVEDWLAAKRARHTDTAFRDRAQAILAEMNPHFSQWAIGVEDDLWRVFKAMDINPEVPQGGGVREIKARWAAVIQFARDKMDY